MCRIQFLPLCAYQQLCDQVSGVVRETVWDLVFQLGDLLEAEVLISTVRERGGGGGEGGRERGKKGECGFRGSVPITLNLRCMERRSSCQQLVYDAAQSPQIRTTQKKFLYKFQLHPSASKHHKPFECYFILKKLR